MCPSSISSSYSSSSSSSSTASLTSLSNSSLWRKFSFKFLFKLLLIFNLIFTFTNGQRVSQYQYQPRTPQQRQKFQPQPSPQRISDYARFTDKVRFDNELYEDIFKQDLQHCHDSYGKAIRCYPKFENAAFQRPITATNTCGEKRPIQYCLQTREIEEKIKEKDDKEKDKWRVCDFCQQGDHPASYLNDNSTGQTHTWWQSETMFEKVHLNDVNITLDLGKTFEITYIRLTFHSLRPESSAIYKKTSSDSDWIPFQYFSSSCDRTFGVPQSSEAPVSDEQKALCTSEHSELSPLSGGNVIFTTLEGRPGANNYANNKALQEFATASEIKFVLKRLNTFRDEIFEVPEVLKSYYYAISDISVGARCKCNGHASKCVPKEGRPNALRCACEHHTAGDDCDKCDEMYNDQPWSAASIYDAHECVRCNCNGKSESCIFDKQLWEQTGHGGRCLDCRENRDGPNCERCKPNFYEVDGVCIPCNCDRTGSTTLQCNPLGTCSCKPGVEGKKCDRCAPNFYDLTMLGCKSCGCELAGSFGNQPSCDPYTGACRCKGNVEGQRCDNCKFGYFALSLDNEFGCSPCFCFGHHTVCSSAPGYSKHTIESLFTRDAERWKAVEKSGREVNAMYSTLNGNIAVKAIGDETIYFTAPERYLGDQRSSYNQYLTFTLSLSDNDARTATLHDIIIESGFSGLMISQPIFGQGNLLPTNKTQIYRFRLHEDPSFGWTPRLTAKEFIKILSNIKAIKIRGNYGPKSAGYLDDVKLDSVQSSPYGVKADWIEKCECKQGYVGQFCESCAPGFRRDPPNGDSMATCIPCTCNNHTDFCDPDSGRCICGHNTSGDNCERCASGYYGDAVQGTQDDCQPCPCPNQGPCVKLNDNNVACLQCPEGYAGFRCDICIDGYYGDPLGQFGPKINCTRCDCNGNVDANAIGNCDSVSGDCLKCIYHTTGTHCEQCEVGYYGNALSSEPDKCKACSCHQKGTMKNILAPAQSNTILRCDEITGQCECKNNVIGRQCDRCADGYWNLDEGNGCIPCNCNEVGSNSSNCNEKTGQCACKHGVTGTKCDQCLPNHYGFSAKGCTPCDCDPIGSEDAQCNDIGQCKCRKNIEGKKCDRCRENMYNIEAGCLDCAPCYNLVQDAVTAHRAKLGELSQLLADIEDKPMKVEDKSFESRLNEVFDKIKEVNAEAYKIKNADKNLTYRIDRFNDEIKRVDEIVKEIENRLQPLREIISGGDRNITAAEDIIQRALNTLANANRVLEVEGLYALNKARERSKKYGQQSEMMSQISKEARTLAEKHADYAEQLSNRVDQSMNISKTAKASLQDILNLHEARNRELRKLQARVDEASVLLDRTKKMANESKQEAVKILAEIISLSSKISSIELPDSSDLDLIEMETKALYERAMSIAEKVESILNQYSEKVEKMQNDLKISKDLLAATFDQQQITDSLLDRVNKANNRATGAIRAGEEILKEANKTLATLKEFDSLVQKSKDEAAATLDRVPRIEEQIAEAERRVKSAEDALSRALEDAIDARDVALEAQRIAIEESKNAEKINRDAELTREKSSKLRTDTQKLYTSIEKLKIEIDEPEFLAKNDDKLAKDVLEKVNQAKTIAIEARAKVKETSKTIDDILGAIESLNDIDSSLLDELEARLKRAEQELRDADLDNRLNNLKSDREKQAQWIRNYEDEIDKLRKDVDNINDIKINIPNACFNSPNLEP